MGIGGGSHGGTMVAYAITKHPDLFKVALELYGVVDRATFNERTNRNSATRWMMKMGGTPEEKPEVYRKANALADVSKIITPVFVMHGEDDPQVPPFESAQFVEALKKHGKVSLTPGLANRHQLEGSPDKRVKRMGDAEDLLRNTVVNRS